MAELTRKQHEAVLNLTWQYLLARTPSIKEHDKVVAPTTGYYGGIYLNQQERFLENVYDDMKIHVLIDLARDPIRAGSIPYVRSVFENISKGIQTITNEDSIDLTLTDAEVTGLQQAMVSA